MDSIRNYFRYKMKLVWISIMIIATCFIVFPTMYYLFIDHFQNPFGTNSASKNKLALAKSNMEYMKILDSYKTFEITTDSKNNNTHINKTFLEIAVDVFKLCIKSYEVLDNFVLDECASIIKYENKTQPKLNAIDLFKIREKIESLTQTISKDSVYLKSICDQIQKGAISEFNDKEEYQTAYKLVKLILGIDSTKFFLEFPKAYQKAVENNLYSYYKSIKIKYKKDNKSVSVSLLHHLFHSSLMHCIFAEEKYISLDGKFKENLSITYNDILNLRNDIFPLFIKLYDFLELNNIELGIHGLFIFNSKFFYFTEYVSAMIKEILDIIVESDNHLIFEVMKKIVKIFDDIGVLQEYIHSDIISRPYDGSKSFQELNSNNFELDDNTVLILNILLFKNKDTINKMFKTCNSKEFESITLDWPNPTKIIKKLNESGGSLNLDQLNIIIDKNGEFCKISLNEYIRLTFVFLKKAGRK